MLFQIDPDTSIHITLSGAVGVLAVKMLRDEFRKPKNGNGNERLLQEIRDGIRELLTIVKIKNDL